MGAGILFQKMTVDNDIRVEYLKDTLYFLQNNENKNSVIQAIRQTDWRCK